MKIHAIRTGTDQRRRLKTSLKHTWSERTHLHDIRNHAAATPTVHVLTHDRDSAARPAAEQTVQAPRPAIAA
jgi:hypothetical protein